MTAVDIQNLKVSFDGCSVLEIDELSFNSSGINIITGASGSGKSTLLRAINRLNECFQNCENSGSVRVLIGGEKRDVREMEANFLRRKAAMVFQHPNVLPVSIEKNFIIPLASAGIKKNDAKEMMRQFLVSFGLWDEVKNRLSARAESLSGGQQQRLCLARAMALEPEILLLDEPTASLDAKAAELVEDYIIKLSSELTIIAVTHSAQQAEKLGSTFIDIEKINKALKSK